MGVSGRVVWLGVVVGYRSAVPFIPCSAYLASLGALALASTSNGSVFRSYIAWEFCHASARLLASMGPGALTGRACRGLWLGLHS